jgi:hypothetical protein
LRILCFFLHKVSHRVLVGEEGGGVCVCVIGMGDGCPRKGEEAERVMLRDGTQLGTGGEERLERG